MMDRAVMKTTQEAFNELILHFGNLPNPDKAIAMVMELLAERDALVHDNATLLDSLNKEVRNHGSSWAEKDGEVIGYMCLTDWEVELGMANGGNVIYPSIDNIKEIRKCVASCGIAEVEVRLRRIVQESSRDD